MSSVKINYISYRVVPIMKQGASLIKKVEPVSAISTNVGYNRNNPNNGNDFAFMHELNKAIQEKSDIEPEKGQHIDIRI